MIPRNIKDLSGWFMRKKTEDRVCELILQAINNHAFETSKDSYGSDLYYIVNRLIKLETEMGKLRSGIERLEGKVGLVERRKGDRRKDAS